MEQQGMLPKHIDKLFGEMTRIFECGKHKLIILAQKQEVLDHVRRDFGHESFIDLRLLQGSVHEPSYTRQMYRNLKERKGISASYWELELKDELYEFRSKVEGLKALSGLYCGYLSEFKLGYPPELTFVVSKPDSPLMVVYSRMKTMVYNFPG